MRFHEQGLNKIRGRGAELGFWTVFWMFGCYLAISLLDDNNQGMAFVIAALTFGSALSWFGINAPKWLVVTSLASVIHVILDLISASLVHLVFVSLSVYLLFRSSRGDENHPVDSPQWRAPTMAVNWNVVPQRFQYLQNQVLDNHVGDLRVARFDEALGRHVRPGETITDEERNELARIYQEILRREDNYAILNWLEEARQSDKQQVKNAAFEIDGLLFVLYDLSDLGVAPFCERMIFPEKPEPPLDWSTLPPDLAYLGEAVDRYSDLQTEMAILDWLDQAGEEDMDELRELAQRMRQDEQKISRWYDKYKGSREEFRVHWLGLIFDHAGIDME